MYTLQVLETIHNVDILYTIKIIAHFQLQK